MPVRKKKGATAPRGRACNRGASEFVACREHPGARIDDDSRLDDGEAESSLPALRLCQVLAPKLEGPAINLVSDVGAKQLLLRHPRNRSITRVHIELITDHEIAAEGQRAAAGDSRVVEADGVLVVRQAWDLIAKNADEARLEIRVLAVVQRTL